MAIADPDLDDLGYEEDEEKRKAAIPPPPPVTPPGAHQPSRFDSGSPVAPPVQPYAINQPGDVTPGIGLARGEIASRPPDLGPAVTPPPAIQPKAPGFAERYAALQPPQRNDPRFAVPGWKKGLGAALSGIAAGFSPNHPSAEGIYDRIANGPYEQAEQSYEQQAGKITEEAKLSEQEQRMKQLDMVPVKVPWQEEPVYVQRKDAAAMEKEVGQAATAAAKTASGEKQTQEKIGSAEKQTTAKLASAEKQGTAKIKSAEDIATANRESRENIASGHDLAMTEIARIRAAGQNDPNKLTNTMKTMKQQAAATLPGIDRALDETERMANKLGPVEGRWNKFWTTDVGREDKEFAHYMDEVGMISSAVTLAHARGRMSNELFEHFQKMFNAGKQAPENMIAALDVAKEWLGEYAKMGEAPTPEGQHQKGDQRTNKRTGEVQEFDGTKWQTIKPPKQP